MSTRRQLTGVRPRFLVHDVARDRIVSEFTPPMDDDGRIDVTMRLATLAPGGYVIRLVASDGSATATRATGIVIR